MRPGRRTGPPRGGAGTWKAGHHTQPTGTADCSSGPRQDPQGSLLDELADARRARDEGAQAAADAAHPYWRLAAEDALRDLARSGRPFTAEDLRHRVGQLGGHHNAVGGLFIAAAKRGEIVPAGFRQATRKEAHGRILRAWVGSS